MCSKLAKEGDDDIVLWWKVSGKWSKRLRWSYKACLLGKDGPEADDEAFANGLKAVQQDDSVFAKKLIVCKITREQKTTLAGNRLKMTGPPRFSQQEGVVPTIRHLASEEEVRHVLLDLFEIPLSESKGLDLTRSKAAPAALWTTM